MHEKILIVDFGSQVTQLIARRMREQGVYCEIAPFQKAGEAFAEMKPRAVILSGGSAPRVPSHVRSSGGGSICFHCSIDARIASFSRTV